MAIERKNSFHLMLSDDELKLLRLLAEQEGLSASDYLRTMMRRMAGPPPYLAHVLRVADILKDIDVPLSATPPLAMAVPSTRPKKRRK